MALNTFTIILTKVKDLTSETSVTFTGTDDTTVFIKRCMILIRK